MTQVLRGNGLHIETSFSNDDTSPQQSQPDSGEEGFFARATKMLSGSLAQQAQIQHAKSWGSTVTRERFNDIDMLESGFAREYLSEECLSPTLNDKVWRNCYMERSDKKEYRLYEDGTNRFLMSAKQCGDTFYISQYEDFPLLDGVPEGNYCAIMKKTPNTLTSNFKLYNCGCEGCDRGFMTYTCGITEHHHESVDRQLLADITHSSIRISQVAADMRSLKVVVPAVLPDRKSRVVWCPRQNGADTPSGATPRQSDKKHFVSSPSPAHHHVQTFDEANLSADRMVLKSKMPEWNQDLKSLVLKFNGGRVLEASSKNFLMTAADRPDRQILQFGKNRKGVFVLDFRFPIAPIQAFGICLSACAWEVEDK